MLAISSQPTGFLLHDDYKYLDSVILGWQGESVPIFIKALPYIKTSLELRVRRFRPSVGFQENSYAKVFDDYKGWIQQDVVRTHPYAIPFTQYVEMGRLELWARESLRQKFEHVKWEPGRALLASIGLQDYTRLKHVSCSSGFKVPVTFVY